jgi:hypothetical protein
MFPASMPCLSSAGDRRGQVATDGTSISRTTTAAMATVCSIAVCALHAAA